MFNPDDWTQDFTLAVARVARGMVEEGRGGGIKRTGSETFRTKSSPPHFHEAVLVGN